MSEQDAELAVIQELSQRIVEAQRRIRILDSIKWDESIKEDFFRHKGKKLPAVDAGYYQNRPLPFDVQEKVEEFRSILRDAQNQLGQYSPVTRLIRRQCDEYIRAVHMLAARGTPTFCELAMELYGSPDDAFYAGGPRMSQLGSLLFDILTVLDVQLQSEADVKRYTAEQAQEILQARLSTFFNQHPGNVTVMVSDDMIADAAAGADTIKLSQKVMFSDRDLQYLEVHEGWVHVGTTLNGALQPYCFFLSKGSPSSSVIQEGLAVITEVISFSSNPGRMRRITNRVIALDKVTHGADFLDIYHYFLDCGLSEEDSYKQSVRVFRGSIPTGGPFTKDLSYAKGFVIIYNFIRFAISQHRIDAIPLLFTGKLVLDDLPLLREIKEHGWLTDPVYLPPQFRDLAALSAWMSFSLYLNKFDLNEIQKNFRFLLG
ncbi:MULTISPECIES: flavohemoglobin expression-modulating QEGLA motif protein [Legionella]|uniref:Flavohemoglobin expression-modulating QEGLA motif protein n=1 Tax=Legionella septentrionalis TaxID=2498109 RepID=A0A3S0VBX1_9GAMM|nr:MULTISPECIES: flavohemoglobin expression-modulating QEGLA motif protein [Legionella]MCP0913100.1 flavohemoglobin expression-modulating QEGLA motif protein [Legionella sp. 27cVA30]RUQ91550.1 flavohemoglobin expression-modulating QEGLA motif protein [Legionella septentrionalis]RUQ94705.1 flavohemoglobin expression-modulating QEGLA motif protein [Legionella septentrionalis]RUR10600.1 flavohemoglobin expression-modulating QEGLA motif protein [Legionella septentrionalis]RUR17171.1 flavohemoglobi